MPLYEYRCHQCGKTFEIIQKFSDEPVSTHENCGGLVERLISAPGLHFKGSGWYITDYSRAGSNGKQEGKESGDKKADTKTESKASDSGSSGSPASSGESKSSGSSSTSASSDK